jgi:hypothetical protein
VLRSGNVLLHRRVFGDGRNLFDAQFGLCGGEDIDFFERRLDDGFSFVWCAEASVSEEITAERLKFSFYTRKHTRMGGLTGEQMRNRTYPLWMNLAKSVGVALVYPPLLPFFGLFGRHTLARNLVRFLYHASRIMGVFGFVPIRDR